MGVNSSSSVNSIYNSMGIKNTGIGGLASGLDTESIVEALTAGTRAKIARQGQLKTVLKWEQSAYRSVANALTKFQEKHIEYTGFSSQGGPNNINSAAFFNVFKGSSTSAIANFNASQSTASGTVKVDSVDQLATNQVIKAALNTQNLISDAGSLYTQTYTGETLELKVGNTTKSIDLSDLQGLHAGTVPTYAAELQRLVTDAFGTLSNGTTPLVKVTVDNSTPGSETIQFEAEGSTQITIMKDSNVLGFRKGQTNKISAIAPQLKGSALDLSTESYANKKLTLKVGNATRDIDLSSLDAVKLSPPPALQNELQNLITAAVGTLADGVTPLVTVTVGGTPPADTIELTGNGSTQVTVVENCDELGLAKDQANFIDPLSATLGSLFPSLGSGTFVFMINDVEFTFKDTDTLGALCNKVTTSKANVSLVWDEHNQQLIFTSKVAGAGENIRIQDVSGRLMHTIVGARGSNNMTSGVDGINRGYKQSVTSAGIDVEAQFASNAGSYLVFNLSINGVPKKIAIEIPPVADPGPPPEYGGENLTAEQYLLKALNNEIISQFGADSGVEFTLSGSGSTCVFTIKSPLNTKVEFDPVAPLSAGEIDLMAVGFFNTATTRTNADASVATTLNSLGLTAGPYSFTITVDGTTFSFPPAIPPTVYNASTTINDIITHIENEINTMFPGFITVEDGKIIIDAGGENGLAFEDQPAGTDGILEALFGTNKYDGQPDHSLSATEHGLYAQITLDDGTVITRNSNTFDVGGIVFDVLNVGGGFTITSEADTDELIDKIKTFVDEYNSMVESLNSLIYEKPVSGYDALTDEQKAEMTEAQIKDWENEAKKGLLYNDATIRNMITEMRTAMTKTVEAAGLSLYDIGIQPVSYNSMANTGGGYNLSKAGIFEVNEKRLRDALENNIDGVRTLFTHKPYATDPDPEDYGVAQALNLTITKYTYVSTVKESQGRLVALAGADNGYSNLDDSEIGNKISRIDSYVATLKMRLEMEYKRHWSKFTALETALSRMSAQSGWLADFNA